MRRHGTTSRKTCPSRLRRQTPGPPRRPWNYRRPSVITELNRVRLPQTDPPHQYVCRGDGRAQIRQLLYAAGLYQVLHNVRLRRSGVAGSCRHHHFLPDRRAPVRWAALFLCAGGNGGGKTPRHPLGAVDLARLRTDGRHSGIPGGALGQYLHVWHGPLHLLHAVGVPYVRVYAALGGWLWPSARAESLRPNGHAEYYSSASGHRHQRGDARVVSHGGGVGPVQLPDLSGGDLCIHGRHHSAGGAAVRLGGRMAGGRRCRSLMSAVVTCVYMDVTILRGALRFDWAVVWRVCRYSAPLAISAVGITIIHSGDRFFLQRYAGPAAVGLYSLAYKFGMLVGYIQVPFETYWDAQVFHVIRDPDGENHFVRTLTYYSLALFGGALFVSLAAAPVIR